MRMRFRIGAPKKTAPPPSSTACSSPASPRSSWRSSSSSAASSRTSSAAPATDQRVATSATCGTSSMRRDTLARLPARVPPSDRSAATSSSAIPMRCSVVGCDPNQNWLQAGGVGSASDRSASCRCICDERLGSCGRLERGPVGARLDRPADRVLHRAGQQRADDGQGEHQRHRRADRASAAGVGAPAPASASRARGRAARRRTRRRGRPAPCPTSTSSVPGVPELVGDHHLDLVGCGSPFSRVS